MMRITRIDARGRNSSGTAMLDYLTHTEYYAGKDGERHRTARWIGHGAATLGLTGSVSREQMDKLAKGYDPITGKALSRSAGRTAMFHPKLDADGNPMLGKDDKPLGVWRGGHRIGFDCTFSSEKTVGLVFANADDAEKQRIIGAHRHAVDAAFEVLEQTVETRRGRGGCDHLGMRGLVASGHTHFGNRDLEPDLHEHVLVYSVGEGEDGQWGSWDAKELYAKQRILGALYRAEMAHQMQQLGYGIEKRPELDDEGNRTGEVYYRVAGISDEIRGEFSTRHKEILAYVEQHGGSTNEAALRTRRVKEEPPIDELYATWQRTLALVADMPKPEQIRGLASKTQQVSDADIIKQLHATEAVWTKTDLITQLARENVGRMSAEQILHEADAFLERNDLIRIQPERNPDGDNGDQHRSARRYTEDRYAARWWVEGIERDLVQGAIARQHDQAVAAEPHEVDAAITSFEKNRGFTMSAEQQAAVRHLTNEGGISLLEGRAGTGKTTTTEAVVKAYTASGRHVIGCSTSWDAATKLKDETSMEACYSTAKLLYDLDKGQVVLDRASVVVMDEAGMAGTAAIHKLAKYVNAAGGKLILEGDHNQLQAIDAGGGFKLLADWIGKAELTEIRRQRNVEDRKTVEMLYAESDRPATLAEQRQQGAAVYARLEQHGQIDHWDTRQEAIEAIARDYLASPLDARQKLVIAGKRSDVAGLNAAIRQGLQERGIVGKDKHTYSVLDNGHRMEVQLAVGDQIRFGKRDAEKGVVNGSRGRINAIGCDGKLRVRLDDSTQEIVVDPGDYPYLGLGYASTVHKAQGQTKEQVFHLADLGMTDRHLSLVAMSRARGGYRLYGAENDLEAIGERLGLERQKVNALEEGIRIDRLPPEREADIAISTD